MRNCYDDLSYAQSRLHKTVVKLVGEFFFVDTIYDFDSVKLFHLGSGEKTMASVPDLDLSPPKLGYVDYGTTPYLIRNPYRQWKQGLRKCQISNMPMGLSLERGEFYRMLVGNYPSLEQCFDKITNGYKKTMPISRHFAITVATNAGPDYFNLSFKGYPVGTLQASLLNPNPLLSNKYQFLQEFFQLEMSHENN